MNGFIDLLLILGIGLSICGAFYHSCILLLELRQWVIDKLS